MSIDQRESERLPASYVVAVRLTESTQSDFQASMTNLSRGGLCFLSRLELYYGARVEISLPADRPVATLPARIVWCRPQRDRYSSGAEFVDLSEARRTRLIEMHLAITAYQKMQNRSGDNQAAIEWLSRHAAAFLADTA